MESRVVDLNHLELLAVSGEDSGKFLQGQLTCDVNAASDRHHTAGAACNNKGRVLASFLLVRRGDDIYMEMQPDLMQALKASLDKYIVFSKARTFDAGADFHRLGLLGEDVGERLARHFSSVPSSPGDVVAENGHILLMRNGGGDGISPRYECWLAAEQADAMLENLREDFAPDTLENWDLQDLRLGRFPMDAAHAGVYTPQPLNYDFHGMVSFDKGCYTGQEIVARMHYRGSAKKRLYPVRAELVEGEPPAGDLKVLDQSSGKQAGDILRWQRREGGLEGVAVLNTEAVENGAPLVLALDGEPALAVAARVA